MKVVMIGTGYVGLVSGACFADFGHEVTCVDTDAAKIEALLGGKIPFFEPGLDDLVSSNVSAGQLKFDTDLKRAVPYADVVFIAVGTPSRRGDGHADLSYADQAARDIATIMDGFTVIVNKSTVPVGTGDRVEALIEAERPGQEFAVVSNPEFLREGNAIDDFKRPDRVVVGTDDERARETMSALYRPLYLNETPIVFTDRRSAEILKYAANAFLATKIAFINEMASLCEVAGGNIQDVARGLGLDKRIGNKSLHPGPGYGGSCFPKDTLALTSTAKALGAPVSIVEAVIASNEQRKSAMVDKIVAACGGSVAGRTIAVLGLTFKPNTDDMRDAPSLTIVPGLQKLGARIIAFDPEGMIPAACLLDEVNYAADAYACCADADAMVLLTEWNQFRALDLGRLRQTMAGQIIIDLRNVYRPDEVASHGFTYHSVGRQAAIA
eukprot:GHVR01064964.1.p1 GENE.GHVR01064964.1~~GHVR01064964.1.p1  ORF type:complete len:439 (+),score=51.94 GHVR01064964.1:1101-2417(+)